MKKTALYCAALLTLWSCSAFLGEEVARLPINMVSTEDQVIENEINLELDAGDEIAIWSDMDMKYEGDLALQFRLHILRDGEVFQQMEIDPMDHNITMKEVKTSLMGQTDWRFMGKNTEVTIPESGTYIFRAILVASENPSLQLSKAELVFRK